MKKSIVLPFIFLVHFLIGCGSIVPQSNSVPITPKVSQSGNLDLAVDVKFWWWSQASRKAGIDMDNPPEKSEYLQLERWRYSDDPDATSPHEIDIIATLKADSTRPAGKLKIFIFGRYQEYERLYQYSETSKKHEFLAGEFEKLPWQNDTLVFEKDIQVVPGEIKPSIISGYDLTGFLNSEFDQKPLCGIRVSAVLLDQSGKTLAEGNRIIPVLLGD